MHPPTQTTTTPPLQQRHLTVLKIKMAKGRLVLARGIATNADFYNFFLIIYIFSTLQRSSLFNDRQRRLKERTPFAWFKIY